MRRSYKNPLSYQPHWKEKAPPAKNREGGKEGKYEWMKWRMEKKKRRKEEYIWIRRSMARLLASWSGFRFRVLHKAASGPCVAVDDDDCDDERLNCQQAIRIVPIIFNIIHRDDASPRSRKNSGQLRNTSHPARWQTLASRPSNLGVWCLLIRKAQLNRL